MKIILLPLLLLTSAFISAQQLDTPNYTVEIQQFCPEAEVQCQNVLYKGTSKISGASIELKGTAWHSLCADGVTPCRFSGYQFKNGRIQYLVYESGLLQVIGRSGRVLLEEQGVWEALSQDSQQPEDDSKTEPKAQP